MLTMYRCTPHSNFLGFRANGFAEGCLESLATFFTDLPGSNDGVFNWQVFDEADMLLCGGFQNQIIRLINLLRFEEKQLSKMEKSMLDNSPKKDIELASTTIVENPVSSMVENDDVSSNAQGKSTSSEFENDFSLSETSQDQQECNGQDLVSNAEDVADIHDIREDPKSEENTLTSTRGGKDWRRARKLYKRSKQYIFVAATLPESGRKTAGGVLKHMFPDAIWVSGDYLHCHNPRFYFSSIIFFT